jgi:hypothetical protein
MAQLQQTAPFEGDVLDEAFMVAACASTRRKHHVIFCAEL